MTEWNNDIVTVTDYGKLVRGADGADTLVVLVPGWKADGDAEIYVHSASRLVKELPVHVLRMSLLHPGESWDNVPIGRYRDRIEAAIDMFGNRYTHIALVGHSLGGYLAMSVGERKDIAAMVLWDPSRHPAEFGVPGAGDDLPIATYLSKLPLPIKIVAAEMGGEAVARTQYTPYIPTGSEVVVISGADHNFSSEAVESRLIEETVRWLVRFCV